MITFVQKFSANQHVFQADAGYGQLLAVVPEAFTGGKFLPSQAWFGKVPRVTFVYTAGTAGVTAANVDRFVAAVAIRLTEAKVQRGYLWLADPVAWQTRELGPDDAPVLDISLDGSTSPLGLSALMAPDVRFSVAKNAKFAMNEAETTVTIYAALAFDGPCAPVAEPAVVQGALSFDGGAGQGAVTAEGHYTRSSLAIEAGWGFQFVRPGAGAGTGTTPQADWFQFAAETPATDSLGFAVSVDPSNPLNRHLATDTARTSRTKFTFRGQNADGSLTTLMSRYRTKEGAPIVLTPHLADEEFRARLAFEAGPAPSHRTFLTPSGDFAVSVTAPTVSGTADLMCGLQGTEVITFQLPSGNTPGDRLRFFPYEAAFAPAFPFPDVSPVTAQTDPTAPLLNTTFTTSWATAVARDGSVMRYVAQAEGAALYGTGTMVSEIGPGMLGWKAPASALAYKSMFPLVPYAGLVEGHSPEAAAFEREVVSPMRRQTVGTYAIAPVGGPYNAVTPTGLLATVGASGSWTRLLLGQTVDPKALELAFVNPTRPLQEAFETSDVFLVTANKDYLGTAYRSDTTPPAAEAKFANTVNIGGWELAANVGTSNRYADYRNILIVKGRKGKLYDRADVAGSLVANPQRWTEQQKFASPTDLIANPNDPDKPHLTLANPAELVVLSQWLQDYFAEADRESGEGREHFNAIAKDENWTGILVLRADIAKVPDDLAGILAGVADPAGFNAHHLGVEITPVTADSSGGIPGPGVKGASSMFGLIDYVDPAFTPPKPGDPAQPVRPKPGTAYDFRLLSLNVAFANTAVRSFRSYAQLTATSWFDMPIVRLSDAGNPYGAIVLGGSLQVNNGQAVYTMGSTSGATFAFVNDAVRRLEITSATMSTRNTGEDHEKRVGSWFGLSGFLDFHVVHGKSDDADGNAQDYVFDVFSFGAPADSPGLPRTGLAFSNLGILMDFAPQNPQAAVLSFQPGEMRFDVSTSTARPGSLFRQFALDVSGLVSGTADTPPSKSGYASVVTDARLAGVDGGPWWGIDYVLPLGSPGNLAGRVGLDAHLVTAWSPSRNAAGGPSRALVGLQLPGSGGGAKLISLQSVLKLSVGQIWLQYDVEKQAFLLLFTEIALKIFGLVSVPPGSTLFYLYGNQKTDGTTPSGLGWYAMYRQDGSAS